MGNLFPEWSHCLGVSQAEVRNSELPSGFLHVWQVCRYLGWLPLLAQVHSQGVDWLGAAKTPIGA